MMAILKADKTTKLGGVTVNEEKVTALDAKFTAAQLQEGLKIRKGKKVYHKAILK